MDINKETTLIDALQLLLKTDPISESNKTIITKENKLLEKLTVLFEAKDDKDDKENKKTEDVPQEEEIEETPQEPQGEETPQEPQSSQEPQEENIEGGGDEQYQDGGMEGDGGEFQDDPGMDGETTLEDVGKMYELKQIHYRLIAVRNHLEIFVEEEFDEVKNSLSKAITLFDLVINNYDKYKEKIDEIIIMYYKFIQDVYELTKKKYKKYINKHKKKNVRL